MKSVSSLKVAAFEKDDLVLAGSNGIGTPDLYSGKAHEAYGLRKEPIEG
jgi:hypothetical protein